MTTRCSMSDRTAPFPLLRLPEPALQAVVDAVRDQPELDDGGALHALRRTCRPLRSEANARTHTVSSVAARLEAIQHPSFIADAPLPTRSFAST